MELVVNGLFGLLLFTLYDLPCVYAICSTVNVVECVDVQPIIVAIGDLPHELGKREWVDVCGVLTEVGDNASAAWQSCDACGANAQHGYGLGVFGIRRQTVHTLGGHHASSRNGAFGVPACSGYSGVISLWGAHAEKADMLKAQVGRVVVQAARLKLGDYLGITMNSSPRSVITVDGDGAGALVGDQC